MTRGCSVLAAIALALIAACRDTTAPDKPLVVTLSIDAPPTPVFLDSPNGPLIKCTFGLTATATGTGTATWQDARTLWYIGPDRTAPVDTSNNAAAEVQQALGAPTISGGQTLHTTWYLYAGAPFEASLGFGYAVTGGQSSMASTRITCGPIPQGAVIPTITQIAVPSMSGELKVGDTVTVAYNATSASGVWVSIVDIAGGFKSEQVYGEHLATAVGRTVKFVVPFGTVPGVPITVSVRAFDAALVGSAKSLETQLKLVDHVPPTMYAVSISQRAGVAGQFAVGDTMTLSVGASDDNSLGWLVYQIGAPANVRDSVPATQPAPVQSWNVKIVVRPEWVGTPAMSVYVRDLGGLTSQTIASQPDSIRFYPIVNRPTTTPLALSPSFGVGDVVYDAKRDLMYVGLLTDNHIVVFSPSTMTLQSAITLPGVVYGMDLSLSGDSLLVAMPTVKQIAVVDLAHLAASLGTIRLSVLDSTTAYTAVPLGPTGLKIAANGKMFMILTNTTLNRDQAVEVDITTGAQRIRTDAGALNYFSAYWVQYMDRTPDRSRIYFLSASCSSRYDATTDTFSPCGYGVPSDASGMTFDAAGALLTRGPYVLDANMQTLWFPGVINQHVPYAALSPDGSTIYFGAGEGITTARYSDRVMLERAPIPVNVSRMFIAPNGQWVLVFDSYAGSKVTRVDLH